MSSVEIDRSGQKVGPIWLVPGVSQVNLFSLLFVAFLSIGLTSFINIFQPYILSEHLMLDESSQGVFTSRMSLVQEIMAILLFSPIGALADKIGRRTIFAFGFSMMALGFFLYPLATNVEMLVGFRVIYAFGSSSVVAMLATVIGDYPQEPSRGKLIGMCGALQGIGVALAAVLLLQLPSVYTALGAETPVWAGRYSLWTVSALCVLAAVVIRLGLKGGVPQSESKDSDFIELMKTGVRAGKNPRISLAFGAAFVSRGDLVIVSNFMSLWLFQAGIDSGLDAAEAAKQAGVFFLLVQGTAVLWAPVIGTIIDKLNRITAVIVAITLAAIGYINVGLLEDPFGPTMYISAILLGIGEISGVLASQALIGQEAPKKERGAVFGSFAMFGAIGIFIALLIGGILYDSVAPSAPFLMMGIANVFLLAFGIIVRIYFTPEDPVKTESTNATGGEVTAENKAASSVATEAIGGKENGSPQTGTAANLSETPKAPEDPKT